MLAIDEDALAGAVAVILAGGLVAYPTDTVYGLGAHGLLPAAVERVFEAKGRPPGLPIPLLLADAEELPTVARYVPATARRLAEAFWPGALTIVLPRAPQVPDRVTAGGDGVAVRVPAHTTVRRLIRRLQAPLTGTSANLSGQPSAITAEEVRAQLADRVDLILDGGRCPGGVPSTVVDLSGPRPRLVREGAIARAALRELLPELE